MLDNLRYQSPCYKVVQIARYFSVLVTLLLEHFEQLIKRKATIRRSCFLLTDFIQMPQYRSRDCLVIAHYVENYLTLGELPGAPLIAPFAMSGILLRSRLGRLPKKAGGPGLRAVHV